MEKYELRLRGNCARNIDIMHVGAANSSGAVARAPLRDNVPTSESWRVATLFAAAPDMLAALKAVQASRPGTLIADIVDRAIRKAEAIE